MATTVFELMAKLGLDSSDYEKGLDQAKKEGSSAFGKGLASAAKVGAVAVTAVATAAVATGKAFIDGAGQVAEYGDVIDKESQKLGISAEAYQEWDAVLQHTGGSVSNLKPAIKTLSKEITNNSEAFQQLGLSQDEVKNASVEEVLSMTISKLQEMEPGIERTRLATQLLGKSSVELGALLNTSAEETQAMKDRVHELGGVMSNDAVKAAAAYQDQLQDMTTAFDGLKRNLMSEFMPSITTVMSGLTELFAGNYDEGIAKISEGIKAVVNNISDALPEIIKVGGGIVEALAEAILDNLPQIIDASVEIILKLVDGLIKALPQLAEGAVQIILALANGIGEALPDLIPAIVDVVISIVDTLIDNVDMLIDGAIALIIGLAEGLIKALPKLIEKAPEIVIKLVTAIIKNAPKILEAGLELITVLVTGIVNAFGKVVEVGKNIVEKVKSGFSQKLQDAKNWGRDLIENFVSGIKEKIQRVKDAVGNVAQTVKDILGFSEPEEGPLSNFHTYAPDMMKLFAQGIKDNIGLVTDAVDSASLQIANGFNLGASTASVNDGGNAGAIESILLQYLPELVNRKIYLDSGALVGATVGAYDVALGTMTNRSSKR